MLIALMPVLAAALTAADTVSEQQKPIRMGGKRDKKMLRQSSSESSVL
jgi:hypothetical protein